MEGARPLAFSTVVFCQLLRSFAARSRDLTFWEVGAFTNVKLLVVILASMFLQVGLQAIPSVRALFALAPPALDHWALTLGLGLVPVTLVELAKLVRRAYRRNT